MPRRGVNGDGSRPDQPLVTGRSDRDPCLRRTAACTGLPLRARDEAARRALGALRTLPTPRRLPREALRTETRARTVARGLRRKPRTRAPVTRSRGARPRPSDRPTCSDPPQPVRQGAPSLSLGPRWVRRPRTACGVARPATELRAQKAPQALAQGPSSLSQRRVRPSPALSRRPRQRQAHAPYFGGPRGRAPTPQARPRARERRTRAPTATRRQAVELEPPASIVESVNVV